jgi:UDP-N-acetylmuramoyl-tripeptide--D-alanyl-D-alanine ligase
MAVRFSEDQVLEATSGRWLQRGARASYEAVCTDTRQLAPGCLFVALEGERFDAHRFLADAAAGGAAGALVQAGKPLPPLPPGFGVLEVRSTLAALGALALFHRRRFKLPVGAVTGSNGKTTTKEMVAAILSTRGPALKTEGNLNNEVGVPLTLFNLLPSHVAAIIEMGMNHAGELSRLTAFAEPDAGLITVVQPAHLMGLGSLEGVASAKGELFRGLRRGATAVVNLDDPRIVQQAQGLAARRLTFGRGPEADVQLLEVRLRGREGMTLEVRCDGQRHEVPLAFVGEHNAQNATGAIALALALGYRAAECVEGLSQARPHARRLNVLPTAAGYTVLDDCYNANPASMEAALQTVERLAEGGRPVAVLGDMLELGDDEAREHARLGARAAAHARVVAFFGPRSAQGYQAASALGQAAAHFTEIEPLLAWLRPRLEAKDVVLVKGSRGMRLERVVHALTGQEAAEGGH